MGHEILGASDRLLAAVMNGVYQGILVTVLVALSFRVFSRTNAATRHAVWLCTLVLLVLLVVAHCFFHSRPPALQRGNNARTAPTPEQEIGTPNVAAVDLFSVVGTSRCDVRAACSGAISSNTRVARIFVPPATTRAGTAQRAIPTITLNTYAAMAATPNGLPTEIGSSGPKWPGSLPDEQEQLDDCVTISGHAGSFLQTHPLPLPFPFRGRGCP